MTTSSKQFGKFFAPEVGGAVQPPHVQEWLASGVDPQIISTNVRPRSGDEVFEFLAGDAIAKTGAQYVTQRVKKYFDRYKLSSEGGWEVTGLDPLNNFERMDWGQFKPDKPRIGADGKPIKYETPTGVEARAILLADPREPDFWQTVLADISIPIILLEGAKKAGKVLTLGYAAIGIPGIWMAGRWKHKGQLITPYLIPEIAVFAQPGRRFIFAFDQDEKPKTCQAVIDAIRRTAELLLDQGCSVSVATWQPEQGKGVDDLWANYGDSAVIEAIESAQPLEDWLTTVPQPGEPAPQAYNKFLAAQAEQERTEAAEADYYDQFSFINRVFGRARKRKRRERVAGLPELDSIIYKPGCLPHFSEWDGLKKIKVERHLLKTFYSEASAKGYRYVLNTSGTGSGKSYNAGELEPEHVNCDHLWILMGQSRLPSTETVEGNFVPVPVRNAGMVRDNRKTPLGHDYLRQPKEGETPDAWGNCERTELFQKAAAKGLIFANETASLNEICRGCRYAVECTHSKGKNYGLRADLGEAYKHHKLRLHPTSAPDKLPEKTAVIWEESSTLFNPGACTITELDLSAECSRLERNLPALFNSLREFRFLLNDLLHSDTGRFGLEFAEVRAKLQPLLVGLTEADWITLGNALETNAEELLTGGDTAELLEKINSHHTVGLADLIGIIAGYLQGDVVIHSGRITLNLPNVKAITLTQAAAFNLYLDATEKREILAARINVKPTEILEVQVERTEVKNLKHYQISGFGKASKDRAKSTDARLLKLIDAIKAKIGVDEVAVADHLSKAAVTAAEVKHLSNSRGTNAIEGRPALVVIALPKPNLGAVRAEYNCLAEPSFTFEQFYQSKVDAEIYQEAGRLRANRYPGREFSIYWVTEEPLPFEAEQVAAIDICLEAAPAAQQILKKAKDHALSILKATGRMPIQEEIAKLIGITQEYLSQLFKNFEGGWRAFKAALQILLDPPLEPETPPTPEEEIVVGLLPEIAAAPTAKQVVEQIATIVEALGLELWRRAISRASEDLKVRIVEAMFGEGEIAV